MLTVQQAKARKLRIKREKAKRECESSLAAFARQSWSIVEPARKYEHNWHVDCIAEHLEAITERDIRNLVINIPPRHMKSLLVSVFWPAWVWGPRMMPSECWLFGSYSPKLATRDSVKARRIIEDPWFMMNWGRQFFDSDEAYDLATSLLRPDQNEKMRYENKRAGTRISTTPGGTGTGDGGDIIAIDDPHKVKGIETGVKREHVLGWWDDEMSNRAMEPKRVCKVIIMQRVHDQDLCGHVLEDTETNWEHLCLPFEYEKKVMVDFRGTHLFGIDDDPRKEEGELLWKARYDDRAVKDLKGPMSPYQKSGQLQQRPTPKEGTTFKRKWFVESRRWNHENIPDTFNHIIDCWDLTFKGKKGQKEDKKIAYNVGWKLGLKKPDIYVLGQFRKQMGIIGQKKYIPIFRATHDRTREIIIERAANGEATAELLREKIPGVILVTPRGSKEDRADAVTWLFEGGNMIFPEDGLFPWVIEAIEEIIGFGPKAKYKDRVDSIVHGIERLAKKMNRTGFDLGDHSKLSDWTL